jgi:hypothetical protein
MEDESEQMMTKKMGLLSSDYGGSILSPYGNLKLNTT